MIELCSRHISELPIKMADKGGDFGQGWTQEDASALQTPISHPVSTVVDARGDLYVATQVYPEVLRITRDGRVEVVEAAVAPEPGRAHFYVARDWVNSSLLQGYANEMGGGVARVVGVEALTLEQIVGEGADIVKLDIEGMELQVLKASRSALSPSRVKAVIVEAHTPRAAEAVARLLRGAGYQCSTRSLPGTEQHIVRCLSPS